MIRSGSSLSRVVIVIIIDLFREKEHSRLLGWIVLSVSSSRRNNSTWSCFRWWSIVGHGMKVCECLLTRLIVELVSDAEYSGFQ